MAEQDFAPRLHALLARSADTAVIFRRGPSRRVGVFSWDRATDEVKLGQWLKGRIYERRADLSPDGKHLIYFAFNGKRRAINGGSWTAVSRAPYLTALDLYRGMGCWEGGGLFPTSHSYWLNNRYWGEGDTVRECSGLIRDPAARPEHQFGAECTGVYYPRLMRDGWTLVERDRSDRWNGWSIFEKPLARDWILRKIANEQVDHPPGKGCYWDYHQLRNSKTGEVIEQPDWEWVEWDKGALVFAEHGKLHRAPLPDGGELKPALIHDFTDYKFQAVKAPYEGDGEDVPLSTKARKRKRRKAAKREKQPRK